MSAGVLKLWMSIKNIIPEAKHIFNYQSVLTNGTDSQSQTASVPQFSPTFPSPLHSAFGWTVNTQDKMFNNTRSHPWSWAISLAQYITFKHTELFLLFWSYTSERHCTWDLNIAPQFVINTNYVCVQQDQGK